MKKIFIITLLFMFIFSIKPIFSEDTKFKEAYCDKIYLEIKALIILAHSEWEYGNESAVLLKSQLAANYSTVYQTMCK